jgi:molecular chaperone GrpE
MNNETQMEQIAEKALEDTIVEVESEEIATNQAEQLRNQIAELSDKYIRAMAEVENTRRRARVDMESALRTRAMAVAESFLPLIDAIGAAAAHSPDDSGITALVTAANSVLANVGIVRIETIGQTLNPQFHNAVSTEESQHAQAGAIISELQSGYMFGDTILRPAMVVVAK